jgi:hypothetical protein
MNIFFIDLDPETAARMHLDKHVVKMILEHMQLLCTTHHVCGSLNKEFVPPYKIVSKNHPCAIWTRESLSNYLFLIKFTEELLKEYTYRYKKTHRCQELIQLMKDNLPCLEDKGFTPPAQAMPEKYKDEDDVVEAYRQYYFFEKTHIWGWKDREMPKFIVDYKKMFES